MEKRGGPETIPGVLWMKSRGLQTKREDLDRKARAAPARRGAGQGQRRWQRKMEARQRGVRGAARPLPRDRPGRSYTCPMARWTLSVMAAALLAALVWSVWWEAGWDSGGYRRGMALAMVGRGEIALDVQHFTPPLPAATAEQMYGGFWCRRRHERIHWWPDYWVIQNPGSVQRFLFIPIWMPLVLFAGAAGFCWRRHVRRRRRDRIIKAGGCPHCGYDLHGLAAHGETQGEETKARAVCPECGK